MELNALFQAIGIKGFLLIIIGLWLVIALTKKLIKIAVVAAVVLAAVYYLYPLLQGMIKY